MIQQTVLHYYFKSADAAKSYYDMFRRMRSYDESPSRHIITHYEKYLLNTAISKSPQGNGKMFEAVIYDAMVIFGVSPLLIHRNTQPVKNACAELDFMVRGKSGTVYAICAKTSLRERWQQADRALLYAKKHINAPRVEGFLINCMEYMKANVKDSWKDGSLAKAEAINGFFNEGLDLCVSAYDVNGIMDLFSRIHHDV